MPDSFTLVAAVLAGLLVAAAALLAARLRTPVCGCRHHLSMHDADGNGCHAEVQRLTSADGDHFVRCTCARYVERTARP